MPVKLAEWQAGSFTVLVLEEHESIWRPDVQADVQAASAAFHAALAELGFASRPLAVRSPDDLAQMLAPYDPRTHLIFNWYEGAEWGAEDLAHMVGIIEDRGFVYTGADVPGLLFTQDKTRAKHILEAHGVPTPSWRRVLGGVAHDWQRYPAIVKVATEHGSEALTGDSVVWNQQALRARLAELERERPWRLMVSEYIDGREFAVAVWGNDLLEVLPIVEIDYLQYPPGFPRIRTYDAKWHAPAPLVCPARVTRRLQAAIESVARRAFRAFDLRDYARIDLRMRGNQPNVIDVNPNPDITADGSFVLAARGAGISYAEMIGRIITLAAQRGPWRRP